MEVYESHLGGLYFSEEIYDDEYLYCDQCGDSDWHLGHAESWQDVLDMVTDTDEDGKEWCDYAKDYLEEIRAEFESLISEKK